MASKLQAWRNAPAAEDVVQERLTQELLDLVLDENAAGLIRSLAPEDLHTPFGSIVLERWLKIAPEDAVQWLANRPDASEHQACLVARRFEDDTAALLAYCNQWPASPWQQHVLRYASLQKADGNPAEAIAFADRLVDADDRTGTLETIAYSWFGRDPVAALRWARSLADASLRQRVLAMGAKAVARVDAGLALEWLIMAVDAPHLAEETALSVLETPSP